jgi:hypothetical protein
MHFSDKSVLIVVYKSPNVNTRCNRRYIGYSSADHYRLRPLVTVFASSSLTRLCNNNRIYICTLSIDGNMNNVLALRVCLVA